MKMPSVRLTYFIGFVTIAGLLLTSLYLQEFSGIMPCPLCVLQRIDFALLGVVFFFGSACSMKKIGHWLIGLLATIFSLGGILLAGRQVWLQHLPPDQNSNCGMSIQYLLNVLPFDQVMKKILQGSAECSAKGWEFLTLSLAEWSLLFFVVFCLLSIVQTFRTPKS